MALQSISQASLPHKSAILSAIGRAPTQKSHLDASTTEIVGLPLLRAPRTVSRRSLFEAGKTLGNPFRVCGSGQMLPCRLAKTMDRGHKCGE